MLAMLAFTACSNNTDEAENAPRIWHVTLTASMDDTDTRALSEGANKNITATFNTGDKVEVVNASGNSLGTLDAQSSGSSTTLSGTLTGSLAVNDVLTLHYISATANYDGQDGTLSGIAAHQHYAKGTITVSSTDPLAFTPSPVSLTPEQSITKFSFSCGGSPVSVKTFGIAATGLVQSAAKGTETIGAVTGALTTPSADVYAALRNNVAGKQKYFFTIQDNDNNWYTGTKSAPLENGKNYATSVTLTKLSALTSSSAVGTIGVVDGLPAIVISGNKAVALMNTGALCPEAYGTYYTFESLPTLSDGWYVPNQTELNALAVISNTWGTQNGVNGRTFTIATGKTLFLPAAGYDDYDNSPKDFVDVSTDGYYWSSTPVENATTSYALNFDSGVCQTIGWYKEDALSVRPFHALPTQ